MQNETSMQEIKQLGEGIRPWQKLLIIFGLWMLVGIVSFMETYIGPLAKGRPIAWYKDLLLELSIWMPLALATPVILWMGRRFPVERPRLLRSLVPHIVGSSIFSLLCVGYLVFYFQIHPLVPPHFASSTPFWKRYLSLLNNNFHFYLFVYGTILGISLTLNFYKRLRVREHAAAELTLRTSQLETRLARAELHALRMQLHPHFLFNTLHGIAALVREGDKSLAIRMIAGLSDLLRIVLEKFGEQETSLKQELEFVEKYLEIERIRFQDRLNVRISVAAETLDAQIPALILQPLVENAIRHGAAQLASAACVEIIATHQEGKLILRVIDNGPGLPRDWHTSCRKGVGIQNTELRLRQLFNSNQQFFVHNRNEGGVAATIIIPFKKVTPKQEKNGSSNAAVESAIQPAEGLTAHAECPARTVDFAGGEKDLLR